MAYEVGKRAGGWVAARSRREDVLFFLGFAALIVIALVAAVKGPYAVFAATPVFIYLARATRRRLDSSERWHKGKVGEQAVGDQLDLLRREGFVVMHDIEQDGEGNVDHLVSGPSGVFLVETKYRRYELRDLAKARRQAAKLHDELGVWVTPVICVAKRSYGPRRHQKVWVMGKGQLLDWIRVQRNQPVDFERLARFADGL